MAKRPDNTMFELQRLVADMAMIERNHYALGSERRENDVEHSFTVALLGWYICSRHQLKLDQGKILKYALAHDFAERYAGDTNTFASDEDRAAKAGREKAALGQLSHEFSDFDDLVMSLRAYEAKSDPEALFVWTVDKMQALILGDLDGWRPYREIEIDYETFARKHGELLDRASPYCKEIYAELLEYCKATYYDRPRAG
jgi:putative hydrolase of HD superfamily